MDSQKPSSTSVRNQLLRWGAVMAVIYAIYLLIFPLFPTIDRSKTVLDIEMLLKNGKQWLAAVYIVGLGVLFYAYWRVLNIVHAFSREQPEAAKSLRRWVLGIGIVCALPLLGLYPITALDVVLYVVRARLWTLYGGSPMLALPMNFPQDPYIRLAGEYVKQPSPYGPLWELIAQIPMQLGITAIGSGVIAMKVISLLSYIGMAILIGWYARQDSQRYGVSNLTALTFFALNPLVLLQAIGNGHNDMLLMALMTLGLILWQRDKWIWATVALTLATLVKVTGLIFLPLFGIAVLVDSPDWKTRIRRGLSMVFIFGAIALMTFRLTGPFPDVFEGTKVAMFNRLGYTPSYMVRIFLIHFYARSYAVTKFPTDLGNYLFILYYAYLLVRLALRKLTLIEAGFLAFFVQLFLGSTFRIWYPLWLIPFAALNLNSSTYWRTFLFGITAELSILSYYVLWRWGLHHWDWGEHGPFKKYWDYWLVMTWLTVPWTFGIPLLVPFLRRRKDPQAFDNSLSLD
jgi:hypothetical protein